MTNATLRGKPAAGNPHVRFDEGEVAPAATPRRGSPFYKTIMLAGVMVLVAAGAGSAYAAVWQPTSEGAKSFLDAGNWDVSVPPTNGEVLVFGPLASAPSSYATGQTVVVEAKLENGGAFKKGLAWTFGPITDTEGNPARRSWTFASAATTLRTALRSFDVTLTDPSGYAGWWRFLYGGVTATLPAAPGSVPTLSTVSAEGFATVKVPDAETTARIEDYASGGTLAKTGAGTLEIGSVSGTDAIVHVKEGSVVFEGHSAEAPTYAPGAVIHLDASRTDTMKFSRDADNRLCVERWGSVDDCTGYATNEAISASDAYSNPQQRAPFISAATANGFPLVDFGAVTDAKVATLGPRSCMLTLFGGGANLQKVREVFYAGYYTENAGGNIILGAAGAYHYYRTQSTPFADIGAPGLLTGDIMLNGRKVAYDHPMANGSGDDYTAMHVFSVGSWSDTRLGYICSDRNYKQNTGGARVGELIVYTNSLTRAQRVATHRYLMRKWMPREKWADYDLDAITVAGADTPVSVTAGGDGDVLRVANVSAHGGALVKTGGGTLEIGSLTPTGVTVEVRGGSVAFAPAPEAQDSPADEPLIWLDATAASSLTFTNESGSVDYVGRWADRRAEFAASRYAAPPAAGSADVPRNAPYMVYGSQNGLDAVSFGTKDIRYNADGDSTWMALTAPSLNSVYDCFIAVKVYSTTTYAVNLLGADGRMELFRGEGTKLLNADNAHQRGLLARWSVDGCVTDPVRAGSFRNDGIYHIVHFSAPESFDVTMLAKDRLAQNASWGMLEMGEVILYNRRLDPAERDRTERYLMRRWLDPVQYNGGAPSLAAVSLPAGAPARLDAAGSVAVASVSGGDGAFVKDGTGTVTVTTFSGLDAFSAVTVSNGTLVTSFAVASNDHSYADGAVQHFDALEASTLTTAYGDDGAGGTVTNVMQWKFLKRRPATSSTYDESYWTAQEPGTGLAVAYPTLQTAEMRPGVTRPFVDFGRVNTSSDMVDATVAATRAAWMKRTGNSIDTAEFHVIYSDQPESAVTGDGYQSFIGSAWNARMSRDQNSAALFGSSAYGCVKNGYIAVDGVAQEWDTSYPTGFHLISFAPNNAVVNVIGGNGITLGRTVDKGTTGGSRIAEVLIFSEPLTDERRALVQKRMMHRWFGVHLDHVMKQDVTVAPGATWRNANDGTMDLTVTNLALAGVAEVSNLSVAERLTVGGAETASNAAFAGNLTIADGAEVSFATFNRDRCDTLAVSGTLTFAGDVLLSLPLGDSVRPAAGEYVLFAANAIEGFDASRWTVSLPYSRPRPARVSKVGTSIVLTLERRGLSIVVR